MLPRHIAQSLQQQTTALNLWLYSEGVGLPVAEHGYLTHTRALSDLYNQLLNHNHASDLVRYFAVDNWCEARRVPYDYRVIAAADEHLRLPAFESSEGPLTWRNWKALERECGTATQLAEAFGQMVERSEALVPALEERLAHTRADYAAHGLNPIAIYAWRERTTPERLREFLQQMAEAARAPFQAELAALSEAVFGRRPGPAEWRALYLNRMYEPTAHLFSAEHAVADVQRAFAALGFDLSGVVVDVENRPRKYAGAFCFPISTPHDVRVSVRTASAHHLVDMLYHEFGHAVHFSGIRADLSFPDREWIRSGTHETFSTLFEHLLGEPAYLRDRCGFEAAAVEALLRFHRFKALLNATWLGAAALTAIDGWLEGLSWRQVETRYAEHVHAFTGVPIPAGFARLDPFVAPLSIYPAGYVIANARVAHWVQALQTRGGEAWWGAAQAQDDIRERIRAGGAVRFPDEWYDPAQFVTTFC